MSACLRCPHANPERDCPSWVGPETGTVIMETNIATGEERPIRGCYYQVMPKLMVEVIKASNRPAAAIESTRNEIAVGLARLAGGIPPIRIEPGTVIEGELVEGDG